MAKGKEDYFELMERQTSFCVQAAGLLEQMVTGYDPMMLSANRMRMHQIENRADDLHREILTRLASEFLTPIDQEDLLHLVQIIDDVTDALDEVVQEMYMYHIDTLPPRVPEFVRIVRRCVQALNDSAGELHNFRKAKELRTLLDHVNTVESEADVVYTEAVHDLFSGAGDARAFIGGKALYESLENCCDLCEHAADVMEQIAVKNA